MSKHETHAEIADESLRDALKDIEATVTSALAHQPEDEEKCGQFLYDALVKCFNIADLACHTARAESEAAVSREAATAENSSAVGNAAKLRDALATIRKRLVAPYESEAGFMRYSPNSPLVDLIDAALAAPPRNCDVGTAEEQAERFYNFCTEHSSAIHGICNYNCPCIGFGDKCHCLCKWLQMPYEEGGAK